MGGIRKSEKLPLSYCVVNTGALQYRVEQPKREEDLFGSEEDKEVSPQDDHPHVLYFLTILLSFEGS